MSVHLKGVDLFIGTSTEVSTSAKERCPPNKGYITSVLLSRKRLGPEFSFRLKGVSAIRGSTVFMIYFEERCMRFKNNLSPRFECCPVVDYSGGGDKKFRELHNCISLNCGCALVPAHTTNLIIRDQNYQTYLMFGLHATNDQNRLKSHPHTRVTGANGHE